jgi:hydroxyacylglutathione hydrolase
MNKTFLAILILAAISISIILLRNDQSKGEKYKKLTKDEIDSFIPDLNYFILDIRNNSISNQGYLKNSLLMPLTMDYDRWLPIFVNIDKEVILICEKDNYEKAYAMTKSLGNYEIKGYAIYDELIQENEKNIQVAEYNENTKSDVENLVNNGAYLLDIRDIKEYNQIGVIQNSNLIPLPTFITDYNKIAKDQDVYIFCGGGGRALLGMSYLKRAGYTNKLIVMRGGMGKTIKEGYSLVEYSG